MDANRDLQADQSDLSGFGYRQELSRTLGSFSSFAAGFSYISILTGVFQMFYLGYGAGGPAFFWTWPLVLGGQMLVALCFAELAARFPLSGGVYQWAKLVGSPRLGVLTGMVYLGCLIFSLAAVPLALQGTLPQISSRCQFVASPGANAALLGGLLVVLSTVINAISVRLLAWINNIGVFAELVGLVLLIVLLAVHLHGAPAAVLLDTHAHGQGAMGGYIGPFLTAAGLTASYTLYGFDTAGTLAEETHDPRRRAPRAILQALLAAGLGGLLLLVTAILATPDLNAPWLSDVNGGLPMIVKHVLGNELGRALLGVVTFAIAVCTLAVHAGVVRLVYAMARDGRLPMGGFLSRVSPRTGLPFWPTLLAGVTALAILVININFGKIVELVSSVAILWANLAYLFVMAAMLRYRRSEAWREGHVHGGFSLRQWGMPVNIAAVLWSGAMVVNVAWPRAEVYGTERYQRYVPLMLTLTLLIALAAWSVWAERRRRNGAEMALVWQ